MVEEVVPKGWMPPMEVSNAHISRGVENVTCASICWKEELLCQATLELSMPLLDTMSILQPQGSETF